MSRAALALVLLLLLLLPAISFAEKEKAGFQKLYEAGQDAFNLGEHERARDLFSRASELAPAKPGPHRWLGRLARIREDWLECVAESTAAVRLRPDSPLLPQVRQDIEACRGALGRPLYERPLAAGQGALAILASVEGAAVTVDKIGKGATPVPPLPLNKGRHVVEVRRQGYRPARLEVEVVPGITVDLVVELEASEGGR